MAPEIAAGRPLPAVLSAARQHPLSSRHAPIARSTKDVQKWTFADPAAPRKSKSGASGDASRNGDLRQIEAVVAVVVTSSVTAPLPVALQRPGFSVASLQ